MDVLKNIYRILKSGGIFITDPEYRKFLLVFTPQLADEIYPGIYQKK
jgi:ubiquinone/menaquinone biosynthesis C-methylase UbiE